VSLISTEEPAIPLHPSSPKASKPNKSIQSRDPLLLGIHLAALISMIAIIIFAVLVVLGAVLIWIGANQIAVDIAKSATESTTGNSAGTTAFSTAITLWMLFHMGLLEVMCIIGVLFLLLVRKISSSVSRGEPFQLLNARRLTTMGWLTVIANCISMKVGSLASWSAFFQSTFTQYLSINQSHLSSPPATDFFKSIPGAAAMIDTTFPFGGWLLALMLFMLARVLREGAILRSEIEGVV